MKQSQCFSANTPNIPTWTTDCVFHFYAPSSGNRIVAYYDNGSGGDAHIYVPWDTSGASDINLGHTTQTNPAMSMSALSGTYYANCLYKAPNLMYVYLNNGPWSIASQASPFADGGTWSLLLSNSSSTAVTVNSGGTTSVSANGGVNWMVSQ